MFKFSGGSLLTLASAIIAAAAAAPACGQWTVTVLQPGGPGGLGGFAGARAVFGDRQGGSYDDGYSHPRLWMGSAASGVTLVEPGPDAGSRVNALTATSAFGEGYVRTSETDGYYAALLWNQSGTSVTIFAPPAGFERAFGYGAGGSLQVGEIESDTSGDRPVLWSGTPGSLVDLLPAGAETGSAVATDGVQQVGFAVIADEGVAALWSGTAASFISLHPPASPAGWIYSDALGVDAGRQVGYVGNDDTYHAAAWQGTGASMVDLHPPGALGSEAYGISGGHICGTISVAGPEGSEDRAAYWTSPSASAFVDLHAVLPVHYAVSEALGIWTDGAGLVRIVGSAYNTATNTDEAILWTRTGAVAVGACCRGSTCDVAEGAACTGPGTAFKGTGTACNAPGNATTPCCKGDFNQAGGVSVQDIFDFLAAYFAGDARADFNGTGGLGVQDIFDFLAAYFTGC